MIIARTIAETRRRVAEARAAGKTIGLIPTMGALHQGHLSLVRCCGQQCDYTVVSIFVNPTQFAPNEDLDGYPRTFEADCRACEDLQVDLIFAPTTSQMYPDDNLTWIDVDKITAGLCGASRPTFFRGVCTVVAKLFNIITPDIAYFGQKDAQQLAVINRMAADLNLPVEIRSCPTVREPDGLAMSSRNRYLSSDQRKEALCLWEALKRAAELIAAGQTDSQTIIEAMSRIIEAKPQARIDYISIVDRDLLQPLACVDQPVLIALAVHLGSARLIDNILVDPPAKNP